MLDYFGKKIAEGLSWFTGFSDVFFLKKIWNVGEEYSQYAITLNFSKKN